MSARKVLLLTYHFPPSGAVAVYRMLGLARYLPKYGWQPIVVAPPRVPWEPEDASLLAQVPVDMPIERVAYPGGFLGKVQRYLAPEAHWLIHARGACLRMIREHQPAAIITSSPPHCVHLLGPRLQRRFGLPWLADFRDPWVTNHIPSSRDRYRRLHRWLEGKVMRGADRLIANTPLNLAGWAEVYPHETAKMTVITNGFDPERFPPPAEPRRPGKILKIIHAGELYYGRDPRPLLDALRLSPGQTGADRLPVEVEFLGRASGVPYDLQAEVRERGLETQVKLLGQVPYADALARIMRADILLMLHTPAYRIGVPAKLYEYLGAGRPILALAEPDGDVAWVLRESKVLHRIAPPTDVARIRQALVELTREIQAGPPATPNQDALRQFTREGMAMKFAECLEKCAASRSAR